MARQTSMGQVVYTDPKSTVVTSETPFTVHKNQLSVYHNHIRISFFSGQTI